MDYNNFDHDPDHEDDDFESEDYLPLFPPETEPSFFDPDTDSSRRTVLVHTHSPFSTSQTLLLSGESIGASQHGYTLLVSASTAFSLSSPTSPDPSPIHQEIHQESEPVETFLPWSRIISIESLSDLQASQSVSAFRLQLDSLPSSSAHTPQEPSGEPKNGSEPSSPSPDPSNPSEDLSAPKITLWTSFISLLDRILKKFGI